ncbi:enoyl-CoA hydratase/isomerase family protein [Acidobacteria bacterium ACD]|nr:MAG: enoyl-CoA hydratase/isomerase family protein [Acidobacteriota bacterium]MCE7957757.1 enoyl-CoA hydratase/isomerase family protein [Acidobacteria bacterium ACB2]MDL1950196.1 enoyl-CoA hydratase/isomerase family protein [Acidobacteria bacterium ACD]
MSEAPPFTTVRLERAADPRVARVVLCRPDLRNAFDDVLIAELTAAFERLSADAELRVVVLAGEGKAFCAGADLNWMKRMVSYGPEENRRDSRALAGLFRTIDACPKPVVCRVQGAALGGGTGLVAVCDVAVAAEGTVFGTTEVRLGIVPAVISPYVVRRIGEGNARYWFLTGERVDAESALRAGLVHRVVPPERLDAAVEEAVVSLLLGGPEAQAVSKSLARTAGRLPLEAAEPWTVETIVERRVSAEGQEGMRAFLEKRLPAWAHRG